MALSITQNTQNNIGFRSTHFFKIIFMNGLCSDIIYFVVKNPAYWGKQSLLTNKVNSQHNCFNGQRSVLMTQNVTIKMT